MAYNNTVLILTGSTISILSTFIYSTLTNAFLSGGRFRKKEEAIFIYLGTAFVLGIFTPLIQSIWSSAVKMFSLSPPQMAGLLIIVGNATVNQLVKRWRHTTPKTLIIYMIGFLLLLLG